MTGRPTKFNSAIAATICERIASGESLTQICKSKGMVGYSTVCRWLDKYEDFREMYAHARECQAEFYAIQIIDISDELPITEMPDPDGGVTIRIDAAGVQRNKLRVDARKWVAAKLLPRKYGERTMAEHSGSLRVTLEQLVCGVDD